MKRIIIALLLISVFVLSCAPQKEAVVDSMEEKVQEAPEPEPTPEPEPEAAPAPAQQERMTSTITPARDMTGTYEGSVTFTNNCANPSCRYKGKMLPPSVVLNLVQTGNNVAGTITVNFANFEIEQLVQGMGCDTFQQFVNMGTVSQSPIFNGQISSSKLTFQDVGDNVWELMLTTDLLQGTIRNNEPGCMGIKSDQVKLSRKRFQ